MKAKMLIEMLQLHVGNLEAEVFNCIHSKPVIESGKQRTPDEAEKVVRGMIQNIQKELKSLSVLLEG